MLGYKRCFLTKPGGSQCLSDTDTEMCPLKDQDDAGGDGVLATADIPGKQKET